MTKPKLPGRPQFDFDAALEYRSESSPEANAERVIEALLARLAAVSSILAATARLGDIDLELLTVRRRRSEPWRVVVRADEGDVELGVCRQTVTLQRLRSVANALEWPCSGPVTGVPDRDGRWRAW